MSQQVELDLYSGKKTLLGKECPLSTMSSSSSSAVPALSRTLIEVQNRAYVIFYFRLCHVPFSRVALLLPKTVSYLFRIEEFL